MFRDYRMVEGRALATSKKTVVLLITLIAVIALTIVDLNKRYEKIGLNRDLNPGPLAPKARIIPLDH